MKKRDFESLMAQYRESLGSCSRVPERKPRRAWVRPVASLGAFAVVAVLATILLWPKDAAATALEKMSHALNDVKHFQAMSYQLWKGKWNKLTEVNYADGEWSMKNETKNDTFVCLASDDGLFVHYKRLPYILKTPKYYSIDEEMVGNRSVLDFVLRHIDSGYYRIGRKQTVVDRGSILAIQLSRQKGGYKAEVIIDKATNRPISAEVSSYIDDTNKGPRYVERFEFGYESIPNPVLPNKPVVDTQLELAKLVPVWEKALASNRYGIVDARVTSTGTIWLVATYDKSMKKVRLPYRVRAGKTEYQAMRYMGSAFEASNNELTVGNLHIAVMGFVSADPVKSIPTQCQVLFGDYRNEIILYPIIEDVRPEESKTPLDAPGTSSHATKPTSFDLKLSLNFEPSLVPSYFPALSLCDAQLDMGIREAYAKANFLRDLTRYDEAIQAYKRIGKIVGDDSVIGYGWWKSDIDTARWFKQEEQKSMAEARRINRGGRRRT